MNNEIKYKMEEIIGNPPSYYDAVKPVDLGYSTPNRINPKEYICDTCHDKHSFFEYGDHPTFVGQNDLNYIQAKLVCPYISKATTEIIKKFQQEVDYLQTQITELKKETTFLKKQLNENNGIKTVVLDE